MRALCLLSSAKLLIQLSSRRTARLPVIYVLTKRPIDPEHAASSLASTSRDSLDDCKAVLLMYDVSYAHKVGTSCIWPFALVIRSANLLLTELVHQALQSHVTLPVVLSSVDRRINIDKKGKSRQTDDSAPTEDEGQADDAEVVDTTPADGVSDLAPAPTPEGLVPSSTLPSKPAAPRVSYDLPTGVTLDECAIFYLGHESLGLHNLLMTHGRNQVRFWRSCDRFASADAIPLRLAGLVLRCYNSFSTTGVGQDEPNAHAKVCGSREGEGCRCDWHLGRHSWSW